MGDLNIPGSFRLKAMRQSSAFTPNPATDYLLIQNLERAENVVNWNLERKTVGDQAILPKQPIDTRNLPHGLYMITVGDKIIKVVIHEQGRSIVRFLGQP